MSLSDNIINEIRDISLIYFYPMDSILINESSKFIGIKVLYGDSKKIDANYNDPLFPKLLKRVLERYSIEKNDRKLILFGNFTRRVISEININNLKEERKKIRQMSYFDAENKLLNKYKPYLLDTIELIFNKVITNNSFCINDFSGYNKSFKLDCTINNEKNSINVLIWNIENDMHFKIRPINDSQCFIEGVFKQNNKSIIVDYKFGKYKEFIGQSIYNAKDKEIIKKIYKYNYLLYSSDETQKITDEEKEKVLKFLKLLKTEDVIILKINDNTYLCSDNDDKEFDNQILYNDSLIFLNLDKDTVRIINDISEGISKYNGLIIVSLSNTEDSVTLRKVKTNGKIVLVKETSIDEDYEYELSELDEDVNLTDYYDFLYEKVKARNLVDVKRFGKE